MADGLLKEVVQAVTPVVLRLLPPEATEVLVKLSVTPKGSPHSLVVESYTPLNRMVGFDFTNERAQASLADAIARMATAAGTMNFDYELQVLVPTEEGEEADYVNYGINGTLDLATHQASPRADPGVRILKLR